MLRIATKTDLADEPADACDLQLSAVSGEGLGALVAAIGAAVAAGLVGAEDAVATRIRHRSALQRAADRLAALRDTDIERGLELVADDLRAVAAQIEGLVGSIETDEVLGAIFARFCIGK